MPRQRKTTKVHIKHKPTRADYEKARAAAFGQCLANQAKPGDARSVGICPPDSRDLLPENKL